MDYFNQPLADSLDDQKRNKMVLQIMMEQTLLEKVTNLVHLYLVAIIHRVNQKIIKQQWDTYKVRLRAQKILLIKTVEDISSKDLLTSGKEFIASNTIVTKLVFLVLILICFLILMNLGIFLIIYFSQPEKNPYLIDGVISGNRQKTILQDPKNSNSITIYRSNNQADGIEFTWSVWLLRNNTESNLVYNNIFNKGSSNYDSTGVAELGNGPGVYFLTIVTMIIIT